MQQCFLLSYSNSRFHSHNTVAILDSLVPSPFVSTAMIDLNDAFEKMDNKWLELMDMVDDEKFIRIAKFALKNQGRLQTRRRKEPEML